MCVCEQLARSCTHAFVGNTWNVSLCALLHLQAQNRVTGGGGGDNLRCSLLPACPASFCSAQLRSVKPQIIHSLGYETEEEGETEGGNERERRGAPHTLRRGQTVSFLSLYCLGSNRLPSPSQFGNRISAQCEDLHSCFISVFKFGSNICLTFPSLFQLFLLLFFFYVPGEVKWSGLLTQGDPD